MRTLFAGLIIVSIIGACKKTDVPVSFSSKLPFSKNPSAVWQIGYSKDNTLNIDQFQLSTFSDTTNVIGMWHPSAGPSGYYPYVGQNRSAKSTTEPTNGWAARPEQIPMEGSNTGQYSLLRFIVPATGNYKIKAVFEGLHFNLSTTDVHILHNSTQLFGSLIDGYGGDPAFHKIEGANPMALFEDTLSLRENDIVTFAVGFGANKNHFNDTTGLSVSIETE